MTTSPPTKPRRFTLEQARQALPYLQRVARDVAGTYAAAVELRHELEHMDEGPLYDLTRAEYDGAMDRLGGLVDEVHAVGAELADFEAGRLRFAATLLGHPGWLVWEPGQDTVNLWVPQDGTLDDARPIPQLIAEFEERGARV